MPARKLSPLYIEPPMPRWWDRMIVILTVAAIGLLVWDLQVEPTSEVGRILGWIDLGLCVLFIIDFGWRFERSQFRWRFVRRNWPDLLGAIPMVGPLRAARLVRIMRIVRFTRIASLARRLARRSDLRMPAQGLTYLTLITIVIWITAGTLFFELEHGSNDGIEDIFDALWWSMTTLSTVGYGDLYPGTFGGRVVAVVTMVCGIGVLGTLAATIASAFVDLRERGRRGRRRYRLRDHMLVLGWNDKSLEAVDDFRHDPRHVETKICVVADIDEAPIDDPQVRFVRGAPHAAEALERASAARAATAIVFAHDPNDHRSDHETALVIHALRKDNPNVRISAELVNPANRPHLERAGCDSVVDAKTVASTLLVRAVQDIGVSDVIAELLSNRIGSEIYRIELPERWLDKTYREYAVEMLERQASVLGIARGRKILLSPPADMRFEAGDEIFVVAPEPP